MFVIAQLYVRHPGPGNTHCIYSRLATSLRSLAIILLKLPYTTLHYRHPRLQPNLLIYLPTRPYTGICLYIIIALTISDTFRIRDFMKYAFRRVTTCSLPMRYHTDLRALIASAKFLDLSIQLRLTVTDDLMQIPQANWPETRRNTYE